MGKAVCGSSSRSPTQEVTSDMKFTDTQGANFKRQDMQSNLYITTAIISIPCIHYLLTLPPSKVFVDRLNCLFRFLLDYVDTGLWFPIAPIGFWNLDCCSRSTTGDLGAKSIQQCSQGFSPDARYGVGVKLYTAFFQKSSAIFSFHHTRTSGMGCHQFANGLYINMLDCSLAAWYCLT